ncbi:biopolymer transporter ExbD [Gilvimarinus sp. SDUM040013]|uniref:Biopolymer transporter ExbD n=1 Tax=Gilvimarinus gilvus TaxID=3058038 RepID=A0ABU4RZ77_9GAMM|nr:biopolymer transporter ExbD [Gilvimarinus sp. SDUM040013]MDO3384624.1 biopolymer transporter ExbD [Gilvimarinus sp. SDUM040013]MDX6850210.1 biopolymer transporter ExbD [Gilvimarinus sp. SDUM040013]
MKQSLRAKRMAKHHRRNKTVPKLNLVSLMDIFTILVFFLLVNSSDVEVLTNDKSIELPASVASTIPETTLVVMVNDSRIMVSGRPIVEVADIGEGNEIEPLLNELNYRAERRTLTAEQEANGLPITIMGDQAIPYTLLKQVMNTCAQAGYRDISLAVNQQADERDDALEQTGATD